MQNAAAYIGTYEMKARHDHELGIIHVPFCWWPNYYCVVLTVLWMVNEFNHQQR